MSVCTCACARVEQLLLVPVSQSERVKLKKCGRCARVRYCSRECQKDDWASHKQCCKVATAARAAAAAEAAAGEAAA